MYRGGGGCRNGVTHVRWKEEGKWEGQTRCHCFEFDALSLRTLKIALLEHYQAIKLNLKRKEMRCHALICVSSVSVTVVTHSDNK